jgi:hypothetical protein
MNRKYNINAYTILVEKLLLGILRRWGSNSGIYLRKLHCEVVDE